MALSALCRIIMDITGSSGSHHVLISTTTHTPETLFFYQINFKSFARYLAFMKKEKLLTNLVSMTLDLLSIDQQTWTQREVEIMIS